MIWALVVVLALATLIPMSRIPHGFVRSFSFCRQQLIVVAALTAVAAVFAGQWIALLCLGLILAWQLSYIAKFFPTGRVQSLAADPTLAAQTDRHLRVMTVNVKLSNRAYHRLAALVREARPQVLVLLETDTAWREGLAGLHDMFPHRADRPLDTGYGMSVWTDRPLIKHEWRELLLEGVPSLRAEVMVADEPVALYILHPEPPVPNHDTKGRDAEIGLVGIEAKADPLPSIVTGDLNDVAWSHTTRRFQRLSGHLDPRVGRGFYNSFHAQYWLLRWPLDHLFHGPRFRLADLQRLPEFGSDHFAMLFTLALADRNGAGIAPAPAKAEDLEEIEEMAGEERDRDRRPIGEDWEQG